MKKKRIATVWLAGCSGCHMSLLDIDERILQVAALADIVKSPIVDGKEFPDVDVALVEGGVASDEHLAEIHHIREKAKILVSFGDCAVTANVPSMRNSLLKEEVLSHAYLKLPTNDAQSVIPKDLQLQNLNDLVVPLHAVVKVDYYIPGCPPSADTIFYVLSELLNDRVPDLSEGRKLKYG